MTRTKHTTQLIFEKYVHTLLAMVAHSAKPHGQWCTANTTQGQICLVQFGTNKCCLLLPNERHWHFTGWVMRGKCHRLVKRSF